MHRVTVILTETAKHFGMTLPELMRRTHTRRISRPRQIAMWLARRHTTCSFPDLAARFGGIHHTTILYGAERIEELRASDLDVQTAITLIERACRAHWANVEAMTARYEFTPLRSVRIGQRQLYALEPVPLTIAEAAFLARSTFEIAAKAQAEPRESAA